jgi:hypothetical protein
MRLSKWWTALLTAVYIVSIGARNTSVSSQADDTDVDALVWHETVENTSNTTDDGDESTTQSAAPTDTLVPNAANQLRVALELWLTNEHTADGDDNDTSVTRDHLRISKQQQTRTESHTISQRLLFHSLVHNVCVAQAEGELLYWPYDLYVNRYPCGRGEYEFSIN